MTVRQPGARNSAEKDRRSQIRQPFGACAVEHWQMIWSKESDAGDEPFLDVFVIVPFSAQWTALDTNHPYPCAFDLFAIQLLMQDNTGSFTSKKGRRP